MLPAVGHGRRAHGILLRGRDGAQEPPHVIYDLRGGGLMQPVQLADLRRLGLWGGGMCKGKGDSRGTPFGNTEMGFGWFGSLIQHVAADRAPSRVVGFLEGLGSANQTCCAVVVVAVLVAAAAVVGVSVGVSVGVGGPIVATTAAAAAAIVFSLCARHAPSMRRVCAGVPTTAESDVNPYAHDPTP